MASSAIPVANGRGEAPAPAATWYVVGFILVQIGCQLALLVSALGAFRVVFRMLPFLAGLAPLVFLPPAGRAHPARHWALVVLAVLTLQLFRTDTYSLLVGLAQTVLYLAILGPLLWVPRLRVRPRNLRTMLLVLWGFHTLSVIFGVLQVYYPGRFQPAVSTNVLAMGAMADGLKVRLANGEVVWRPMGLTDLPGGACGAGLFAFLFGLGFLLIEKAPRFRLAALGSMALGLFCIYLCQVRSMLIMGVVGGATFAAILLRRGEIGRSLAVVAGLPVVLLGTFAWASFVGGDAVVKRYDTLYQERFDKVYYNNRGVFLTHTVTELLPRYPLGAGLGRWGMMDHYFGDRNAARPETIYVEIQWTGWLLDGGVPLVLAYSLAVAVALLLTARIALSRLPGSLPRWGALVFAYDMGAVAITFNYPLFIGQGGMEFWLLNAVLFVAAVQAARQAKLTRRAALAPA
jgi:hypothetical protein